MEPLGALGLLFLLLPQQPLVLPGTYVVDGTGAAGGHFQDLQVAVSSVPAGSVLVLRDVNPFGFLGDYPSAVIGKRLSLFADPDVLVKGVTVRNLPAQPKVVLSGLEADLVIVEDCAGTVVIEGYEGKLRMVDSARVLVRDFESKEIIVQGSIVDLSDGVVHGPEPPDAGIELRLSSVASMARVSVHGHASPFFFFGDGFGGDALQVLDSGSRAELRGGTSFAGNPPVLEPDEVLGGVGWFKSGESIVADGPVELWAMSTTPGLGGTDPLVTTHRERAPTLRSGPGREGRIRFEVQGTPGQPAVLFLGTTPPPGGGTTPFDPGTISSAVAMGTLDEFGRAAVGIDPPTGSAGDVFWAWAVVRPLVAGVPELSNAVAVVVPLRPEDFYGPCATTPPGVGPRGRPLTFDGTKSIVNGVPVIDYVWSFGDGGVGFGPTTMHTYTNTGTFTVELVTEDAQGQRYSCSFPQRVTIPPECTFVITSPLTTPLTAETVRFDASASFDPDGTIAYRTWDFGDGTTTQNTGGGGITVSHTYYSPGTYTVELTVRDDAGFSVSCSQDVEVLPDPPPLCAFQYEAAFTTVDFDGSASSDPNGTVHRYVWDFGDGTSVNKTSPLVTHVYPALGTYDVTLTVMDDAGNETSCGETIVLTDQSPLCVFTATSVLAPAKVLFDAIGSVDDAGPIAEYAWDFGDGTTVTQGPGQATVLHVYGSPGVYTVTLTVTDGAGAESTCSKTVTVAVDPPPTCSFGATAFGATTFLFDAGSSADPGSGIAEYAWSFGDGDAFATSVQTVAHSYAQAGTYVVTLTVTDHGGNSTSCSQTMMVGS